MTGDAEPAHRTLWRVWQEYGYDADKIDNDKCDSNNADRSLRNELPSLPRIHKR